MITWFKKLDNKFIFDCDNLNLWIIKKGTFYTAVHQTHLLKHLWTILLLISYLLGAVLAIVLLILRLKRWVIIHVWLLESILVRILVICNILTIKIILWLLLLTLNLLIGVSIVRILVFVWLLIIALSLSEHYPFKRLFHFIIILFFVFLLLLIIIIRLHITFIFIFIFFFILSINTVASTH